MIKSFNLFVDMDRIMNWDYVSKVRFKQDKLKG